MSHPHKVQQVVACPAPEQVTKDHIDNLSVIIETVKPFILPAISPFSEGLSAPPRLEGEALLAATTTFIKACTKLDELIDAGERWTVAPNRELFEALKRNYEQQFEFLKSQTMASNSLSRPFFLLKPDLVQLEDRSYIAFWGDIETPGCGLVGRGETPAAAFADFDAAYFRQSQIRIELPDEPPDTPEPKTKPRKKK